MAGGWKTMTKIKFKYAFRYQNGCHFAFYPVPATATTRKTTGTIPAGDEEEHAMCDSDRVRSTAPRRAADCARVAGRVHPPGPAFTGEAQ
jgi:hypothetical protein